ncbi:hypothetical protein [Streptomyces subrutilus]|uniref:hypothetical protein n=1 Tax=Streptomyces subrutilus TaxID=36818 RepID=UPI002E1329FD|nr:hypothetical protein OG479_23845 [Streptomyces subrutilus]
MRPVTFHTLVRYRGNEFTSRWCPEQLSVDTARRCIGRGRRAAATVHVYETTDRDGHSLHVAYLHFGPGIWDNADFLTDIYEIPTEALTSL